MSNNDLRVIKILNFISNLVEAGHFKIYGEKLLPLIADLVNEYRIGTITRNQIVQVFNSLKRIEDKLIDMELHTNLGMLFITLTELAENYLRLTKETRRVRAWNNLLQFCVANDIMQHMGKKNLTDWDIANIERGNLVAEIIAEF